jgi:hypothetical protein
VSPAHGWSERFTDSVAVVVGSPTVWSSLSSELSSAHGAKQRHSHRFLIPGDPALTIGCVKGGEAVPVRPPSPGFIAGGCYGIVRREFSRVFQGSALRRPRPGGGSYSGQSVLLRGDWADDFVKGLG